MPLAVDDPGRETEDGGAYEKIGKYRTEGLKPLNKKPIYERAKANVQCK